MIYLIAVQNHPNTKSGNACIVLKFGTVKIPFLFFTTTVILAFFFNSFKKKRNG